MKRLSSLATPWVKWAMPAAWLLIIASVAVLALTDPRTDPVAILVICIMPLFLGLLYRFQIWPLADAVDDVGDALRVRRRGVEVRVPLAEIINVSAPRNARSRRVTLRLRRAGELGDEIAFLPAMRLGWNPFTRDPMVEELIRRVDSAQAGVVR